MPDFKFSCCHVEENMLLSIIADELSSLGDGKSLHSEEASIEKTSNPCLLLDVKKEPSHELVPGD